MRRLAFASIIAIAAVAAACQRAKDDKSQGDPKTATATAPKGNEPGGAEAQTPGRAKQEQIPPPFDIKTPPADAVRRPSGLIYKIMVKNDAGTAAKRNDIVLINYTGWRQTTGETFYSNRTMGKPMPLNLSTSAPGFTEAMQLVKKGEKAMLWIPPSIGTRGTLPPQANADTLVYEVEVVDIKPAPEIPTDLKEPAANAQSLKSGVKYVVLRPGTGKEKARSFDTISYHSTSWDSDGRQLESTEMRGRPAKLQPFRQSAILEEVLTSLTVGERVRLWADTEKVLPTAKNTPGAPKRPRMKAMTKALNTVDNRLKE